MYKNLIRNREFIFINIIFLILAVLVYLYLSETDKSGSKEIATAILVTGLSLSIGIKQLQIENDKMFKDLFTDFNKLYDNKFNNCLNEIEDKYEKDSNYDLSQLEKKLLIDYMNLCAEEYLWYTKNRIDENVWQSWRNGMIYYINIPPINIFILNEKGQADSYYGLFKDIGDDLKNWN